AHRAVFQGIEKHARTAPISLPLFPQSGSVGAGVPDRLRVSGMVPGAAVAAPRPGRRRPAMVAMATKPRLVRGSASGRRRSRRNAAVPLVGHENGPEEAPEAPARSATARMPEGPGKSKGARGVNLKGATPKLALRVGVAR